MAFTKKHEGQLIYFIFSAFGIRNTRCKYLNCVITDQMNASMVYHSNLKLY
jgi:hypothetical protein